MSKEHKILLVDDEPNNLKLLQQILVNDYDLIFATDGEQAIEAVKNHQPDLILLDIMMPGMSGFETCEKLKSDPDSSHIPVIFVTAMTDVEDEAAGFNVGGVDYIHKPISATIVKHRIKTHLSLRHVREMEDLISSAILMLGEAGHHNDTDTGSHIWRMASYSAALAQASGWSERRVEMLEKAAPLHDTGKIGIPDTLLQANRNLTTDEWLIMKRHSLIGFNILSKSNNPVFTMAAEIALNHHEKWDGSGYPRGLKGKDIPESARIVALADVFDALTTKRPYKQAWPVESAIRVITEESRGHFDPELLDIFIQILPQLEAIKAQWSDDV